MEECFLDAEEVEGSIPSAPTIKFIDVFKRDINLDNGCFFPVGYTINK